jgi:hypothetical protein
MPTICVVGYVLRKFLPLRKTPITIICGCMGPAACLNAVVKKNPNQPCLESVPGHLGLWVAHEKYG